MDSIQSKEILKAGTGDMLGLTDVIHHFEHQGYTENLVPVFDHFTSGEIEIYPSDFTIDEMYRFENTSDPDDQSILYAISLPNFSLKGIYIESYGLYHDELSTEMLERIKFCLSYRRKANDESISTNT